MFILSDKIDWLCLVTKFCPQLSHIFTYSHTYTYSHMAMDMHACYCHLNDFINNNLIDEVCIYIYTDEVGWDVFFLFGK